MPLIKGKSKITFDKNLKTEMHSGKPLDQSLAIAYSIQRKNKRKKMAEGGKVEEKQFEIDEVDAKGNKIEPKKPLIIEQVSDGEMERQERAARDHKHDSSVVEAIMRRRKKMADGGEVDLEENAKEQPNLEDQLSYEALHGENYSEQSALDDLDQPEDSNQHGDDIDSDIHDMVDAIRRKIKTKRSM